MSLFSPLVFPSGHTAANRIVLAPMTNLQSHEDGSLSEDELHWLQRRAEGGFGMIETCAAHVSLDGQGWRGELGIFDDSLLPGLTRLAAALRAAGSLSVVQIFHGGTRSPRKVTGLQPWSASEQPEEADPPRAASEEDIWRVIAAFRDAAVRAHKAGFDGVELHGAHGYLLGQFLSRSQNHRDDAWGGTAEGRARLLRETTRAVRAAVPKSFLVGVRISSEDIGNARGLDLDESLQLAAWLAEDGIDFLHVSLWDVFKHSTKYPDKHPLPLYRAAVPREVPIITAGSIWTREDAEKALALGADAIALGRAAIANPDWPREAQDASWQPKRPPLTAVELRERALSNGFVNYMRNWKGFVAD
jgi:2,4-dienoyl-CoA reductase-like NADH-dependent reductase (Old Yellow Enzyme family)